MQSLSGEPGPFENRLDTKRVAVAGHSFGAFTALAVAGEAGPNLAGKTLADPRVRAIIPLSAPVPVRRNSYEKVYDAIAVPCLHMTGTLDETPIAFTKADQRRVPFDHITRADQDLVTFVGGDHAIFTGRVRRGRSAERDQKFQELIRMSTTAFLDACLKKQADARDWMRDGGLKAALGANARLEYKPAATQPAEPEEEPKLTP